MNITEKHSVQLAEIEKKINLMNNTMLFLKKRIENLEVVCKRWDVTEAVE